MDRRVVRVRVPTVTEYDVVFEDGKPIFVGAVINRPASAKGPDAGRWIDTHRMTWDGRGGAKPIHPHPKSGQPLGLSGKVIAQAVRQLSLDPSIGRDARIPNQLGRPFRGVRVPHR